MNNTEWLLFSNFYR